MEAPSRSPPSSRPSPSRWLPVMCRCGSAACFSCYLARRACMWLGGSWAFCWRLLPSSLFSTAWPPTGITPSLSRPSLSGTASPTSILCRHPADRPRTDDTRPRPRPTRRRRRRGAWHKRPGRGLAGRRGNQAARRSCFAGARHSDPAPSTGMDGPIDPARQTASCAPRTSLLPSPQIVACGAFGNGQSKRRTPRAGGHDLFAQFFDDIFVRHVLDLVQCAADQFFGQHGCRRLADGAPFTLEGGFGDPAGVVDVCVHHHDVPAPRVSTTSTNVRRFQCALIPGIVVMVENIVDVILTVHVVLLCS